MKNAYRSGTVYRKAKTKNSTSRPTTTFLNPPRRENLNTPKQPAKNSKTFGEGKLNRIYSRFSCAILIDKDVFRTAPCQLLPNAAELKVPATSPVCIMFFTIRYS